MGIVSGEEARQVLFPVSPQSFLEQYWQRRPIFIRGAPEKFQQLFDWERFHLALADHENRGVSIRVSFDNANAPGQMSTHVPISAAEVPGYLERGASVCADPSTEVMPRSPTLRRTSRGSFITLAG